MGLFAVALDVIESTALIMDAVLTMYGRTVQNDVFVTFQHIRGLL